ncbi:VCBS repeat-containing protein [Nannocystis sp. SCPEA4]|uniref:FG-GAP repeat domain-containing protein n=1 Tax=Nannocystis sp. SCPEA4 TaxID=2996787 RepID=UPI00226DA8E5|nr:VCBS repeat-containing protein [Nannocystis sp. SCPEA4]MCY1056181.1 VCBS repeat-containing protein [Nannocystis sp. SCPEA4]
MTRWIAGLALLAAGCEMASEQCSLEQVCAVPGQRFGVGGGSGSGLVRDLDGDGRAEWVSVSPGLGTLTVAWGWTGAAETWSIGQAPGGLALGDVDGDGKLDVAVPLAGEGVVALLRGAGPGRLGPAERVAVGPRPGAIAAADLDGDGAAELIVADQDHGDLRVVRGGAVVGEPVAAGAGPTALVTGDFSGDGVVDVAVALAVDGLIKMFIGTGDGGLRAGATLYAGAGPQRALAADFDDDGALDLAVIDGLLDEAAVVLGDGAGGVRETRRWAVAAGPQEMALRTGPDGHELLVMSQLQRALTRLPLARPERRTATAASGWQGLAVGDVDGDGADEVVVGDAGLGALPLVDGQGFGFSPWYAADGAGLAGPLAARDVDRDGWIDLVVSDGERGEIALLRGQEGGFAAPVRSPGPSDATALVLADLDGDGADDVVTWRHAGYAVTARAGSLWSARGVGQQFASPVEFEFAGDPRRVVAFDGDGDGRSELLALQAPVAPAEGGESADGGAGLLTLELADDAFSLIDRAMATEFAVGDDVLVGDFSREYAGDELIRVGLADGAASIVIESRSAGRQWSGGALPAGRVLGLARADLDGDGIADLLVCGDEGLLLAAGRDWNAFGTATRVSQSRCDGVVVAELDGDGRPDAITLAERFGEPVAEVQLGHALAWLPQLVPGGTTTASNRPRALAVADFDGDGLPDLAASGVDGLQVLRGGPQAVLRPAPALAQRAAVAGGLELGDVDGDGRDEVAAFGLGGDVGLGEFDRSGALGPVRYDMSMKTGGDDGQSARRQLLLDVDGDGADELLVGRTWQDGFVSELLRVRGGRWERATEVPHAIASYGPVRAGDLDGDGDDEVVYVHTTGMLVMHAGGPDGLGPPQIGPFVGDGALGLDLGDVDGDGRLDAVLSTWDQDVAVFPGDGRGGFVAAPQTWSMGWTTGAIGVADLDDDGSADLLAVAGFAGGAALRVCHGGANGPRGDCRDLVLGPEEGQIAGFAAADVDGDGVTDLMAVLVEGETRSLVFGRGGEGGLAVHVKPLPDGWLDADARGVVRRARLDEEGPEWVYVDGREVTRLGVRAR